jgi:hypothetical protein
MIYNFKDYFYICLLSAVSIQTSFAEVISEEECRKNISKNFPPIAMPQNPDDPKNQTLMRQLRALESERLESLKRTQDEQCRSSGQIIRSSQNSFSENSSLSRESIQACRKRISDRYPPIAMPENQDDPKNRVLVDQLKATENLRLENLKRMQDKECGSSESAPDQPVSNSEKTNSSESETNTGGSSAGSAR